MADIDADRQRFRANAVRETIYPEGIADVLIEGSEDPRWGFFLVWGSTARGDSTDISDIDIYAEPIGAGVDLPWVLHFRDRMRAYNVDFLIRRMDHGSPTGLRRATSSRSSCCVRRWC